jgi:hypothetical protein
LSIKALIESMDAEIAFIDTDSDQTQASAVSLGMIISTLDSSIEVDSYTAKTTEVKEEAVVVKEEEITTEEYGWRDYEGETIYDEKNDCFWVPECWYEANAVDDNLNYIIDDDYVVTHWMPLPEPPKNDFKE